MSEGQGSRWRWQIARALNRLPGQCWSDLVMWALAWHKDLGERRWPWSPIGAACRGDVAQTGTCYCGKMQTPEWREKFGAAQVEKVPE